ncbi:amidase [Nocardia grenadensis]|uniref:amidase n=1 Tax=Nocardia grenadensis TaxID=931537 RepID=UPI003D75A32B
MCGFARYEVWRRRTRKIALLRQRFFHPESQVQPEGIWISLQSHATRARDDLVQRWRAKGGGSTVDPFMSAVESARLIRTREVSPVEVAELYLDRIDRFNGELNAFVWRNDDHVLAAARAAEQAVIRRDELPPFHGVPLPLKDLTAAAGQPDTRGSLGISKEPKPENELVVDAFLRAGFNLTGRTNTPELGVMTVTENRRYGITRNPWNLRYSPAGSSGGAAAAVAAGLAPIAHGNDGGGSLRMPASACGLVGLKPSRARVPQRVQSWWLYCTTDGVLTRTVRDTAAVLDCISEPDRLSWFQAPRPERAFVDEIGRESGRLRIGLLLDAPTGQPVDPQCEVATIQAARLLEGYGHIVEPVAPELFSGNAIRAYVETVIPASLYTYPFEDPDLAEPYNRHRWLQAQRTHAGEYAQAARILEIESRTVVAQWKRDFDVLLTPTMACTPPLAGTIVDEANRYPDEARPSALGMVAFTTVASISGLPAISLPVHLGPDGLPVGVQLIGSPFDESTLLRLASALERDVAWTTRIPENFR